MLGWDNLDNTVISWQKSRIKYSSIASLLNTFQATSDPWYLHKCTSPDFPDPSFFTIVISDTSTSFEYLFSPHSPHFHQYLFTITDPSQAPIAKNEEEKKKL